MYVSCRAYCADVHDATSSCLKRSLTTDSKTNSAETVNPDIAPAHLIKESPSQASPNRSRELLTLFVNTRMLAWAEAVCCAGDHFQAQTELTAGAALQRVREFDTRVAT